MTLIMTRMWDIIKTRTSCYLTPREDKLSRWFYANLRSSEMELAQHTCYGTLHGATASVLQIRFTGAATFSKYNIMSKPDKT